MNGGRYLRFEALAALVFLVAGRAWSAEPVESSTTPGLPRTWLSAVLAAELPKYLPPDTSEAAELSESSEPAEEKDGVLALPTLTVRPIIKESPTDYAFLTDKGRRDLALKIYPGLRFGNIFGLNNGIALAMQAEEQQGRNSIALFDRLQRTIFVDSPDSGETMRLLKSALSHPDDSWLTRRPGRK